MPDQKSTASESGSSVESVVRLLQLPASIAGLGILFALVAVVVRWIAFVLDPTMQAAVFLAPALPPVDLVFVGGQVLLTPPIIVLAVLLIVSTSAFAPHMSRARAYRRFQEASRNLRDRSAAVQDIVDRVSQEAVKPAPSASRLKALQDEINTAMEAGRQAFSDSEDAYRTVERVRLASDERNYPIRMFGLAFSSTGAFIGFIGMAAFFVVSMIAAVTFPAGFLDQLTFLVVLGLILRVVFSSGDLRPRTVAPAIFVALAGAIASGALEYRAPIGDYDWNPGAAMEMGQFAYIGATDGTTYVASCGDLAEGVVAVPSTDIRRVAFAPALGQQPRSTLWTLFTMPASTPMIGPLIGCDSP